MKLCNAPERKRERQLGALERLQKAKLSGPNDENRINRMAGEIKVLEKRTEYSRRGIRTKKIRSI